MLASICTSSSSSMRATLMPVCIATITVLTALARSGNWHTADRNRLGNAVQAQLDFGDHAERSLGADEQSCEIVAGAGLARAPAGA